MINREQNKYFKGNEEIKEFPEKRKTKTVEDSLGYMAWDIKKIATELEKLNQLLAILAKNSEKDLF